MGFRMGILPQQLYEMSLHEFSLCAVSFNSIKSQHSTENIIQAYNIASLANIAIAGKLKNLEHYLPKEKNNNQTAQNRPVVSKTEFDRLLELAKKIK